MEGNVVADIIHKPDYEDDSKSSNNTLQDTIDMMGKTLYERYPLKTSVLTHENINGMVRIDVLNEYMKTNFGYEYKSLKVLCQSKGNRVVSKDGFGITAIIEFVKSIQASFEQTLDRLRERVR